MSGWLWLLIGVLVTLAVLAIVFGIPVYRILKELGPK
jgi:hypothetical protein